MFKRFGHFGIAAKDPEALCKWYCDVLGFKVVFEIPKTEHRPIPIYFIQFGTKTAIEIIPASDKEKIERETNDPGFSHIGIPVNDFDEAAHNLKSKGITLRNVRQTGLSWKIGYFDDPEGNLIEIVFRLQESPSLVP